MLIHKQTLQQQKYSTCTSCYKNIQLVKKYQQLIEMYKKKQIRLTKQRSNVSNSGTTSHSEEIAYREIGCYKLAEVFNCMTRKKYMQFFRKQDNKTVIKFALMNVFSKVNKFKKIQAFQKIKNISKDVEILSGQKNFLDEKLELSLKRSMSKQRTPIAVMQQLIYQLTRNQQIKKYTCQHLNKLKQINATISNNYATASRKITQLQISNATLTLSNTFLILSLQQLHKRQAKQNQKKKESLEMLAEQITQKNQQILILKQELKAFEQTYKHQGRILEDQVVTVKKDLQMLENIRDKLQIQLEKSRGHIQKLKYQLTSLEQKFIQLQQQNKNIRKTKFQADSKILKAQKTSKQFSNLILILQRKLKRLSTFQKQIISLNQVQSSKVKACISPLVQQLKSELILLYLQNISDPTYQFPSNSQKLFDQQQKQLLLKHKNHWVSLQNQAKLMHYIEHKDTNQNNKKMIDLSGIQGKGNVMDSIFDALDSPREYNINSNKQGPTMRMLQLQLQINKQIQKISSLKQKFLHIRIIVLNLLKSLQLQTNVKIETMDILRVVFDMFQYSEQERDSIFVKKKKLFSFLR